MPPAMGLKEKADGPVDDIDGELRTKWPVRRPSPPEPTAPIEMQYQQNPRRRRAKLDVIFRFRFHPMARLPFPPSADPLLPVLMCLKYVGRRYVLHNFGGSNMCKWRFYLSTRFVVIIATPSNVFLRVCVCVLSSHLFWTSGVWTNQPGSHRRNATRDFSIFLQRCLP